MYCSLSLLPFTSRTNNPPLSMALPSREGAVEVRDGAEVAATPKREAVANLRREGEVVPTPLNETIPVGGRLTFFRQEWSFDPWAHSVVSRGLGWAWKSTPPPLRSFYQEETPAIKSYVQDLLAKSVVKKAKSLRFQGRLFCVPKKDSDKERVILDLSVLNLSIQCDRFRMLTISQVRTLLPRGAVTISIDLTDAYWHIPIARRLTPFLGFRLGNQAYTFKAMPFGLNIAPRVFTKLADSVVQELRRRGILVAAYLDDWIIWAASEEECLRAAKTVLHFLERLGFQKTSESHALPRLPSSSGWVFIGIWILTDSPFLQRNPETSPN